MKHYILLLVIFVCYSTITIASEISEKDTGVFVLLGKNQKPTNVYYRLSIKNDKWLMEGKMENESWKNISCEKSCEYHSVEQTEAISYLPEKMISNYDIACIQNIAQAFCRYSLKSNEKQVGYVIIALVTGKPIPMILKPIQLQ